MNKTTFLKAYSNLPEKIREDIVAVINDRPYSWNAAAIEIRNDSKIGKEILKILDELGL